MTRKEILEHGLELLKNTKSKEIKDKKKMDRYIRKYASKLYLDIDTKRSINEILSILKSYYDNLDIDYIEYSLDIDSNYGRGVSRKYLPEIRDDIFIATSFITNEYSVNQEIKIGLALMLYSLARIDLYTRGKNDK